MLAIVKKHFYMRKDIALTRVSLVKYLLVLEKPMHFLTLDLKTKLIIYESTFMRSLYGMVVYKVLKSKVGIDLVFFWIFSLVAIYNEI